MERGNQLLLGIFLLFVGGLFIVFGLFFDLGMTGNVVVVGTTCVDLQGIALDGDYVLTSNVDCSGVDFVPIGSSSAPFTGSFDGMGHVISGVTIGGVNGNKGLFAYTYRADISNVGLEGVNIDGGFDVGGLVGYGDGGSISNSYVRGSVGDTSSGGNIGGVAGDFSGIITNTYFEGDIGCSAGHMYSVGGLVGVSESNVINSYSVVDFSCVSSDNEGGLVGTKSEMPLENSYYYNNEIGSFESCCGIGSDAGSCSDCSQISPGFFYLSTYNVYTRNNPKWDFTNVWEANVGDYPTLRVQEVVDPPTPTYCVDLFNLINREGIDFAIVKDNLNIVGIVTKKELAKIEPILFDKIEEQVHQSIENSPLTHN